MYHNKYLKYKLKYLDLKNKLEKQNGGSCPLIKMGKGTLKLINEGCDLQELIKINNNIETIKSKGFSKTEAEAIKTEFTVEKLLKANFNASQLKSIGLMPSHLRGYFDFDFKQLKQLGFSILDLKDLNGCTPLILKQAEYSANELLSVYDAFELRKVIPLSEYKREKIDISRFKNAYNTSQLKTVYDAKELKPHFKLNELAFYDKSFYVQVFSIKELRDAGFTLNDFKNDFLENGSNPFSTSLLLTGFTPEELSIKKHVVKSGSNVKTDITEYYNIVNPTLTNMLLNGYEVKEIKDYLGFTYNDFKNNKIYEPTFEKFYTAEEKKLPASRAIESDWNLLSDSDRSRLGFQSEDIKALKF
jgi:hypothetical protein